MELPWTFGQKYTLYSIKYNRPLTFGRQEGEGDFEPEEFADVMDQDWALDARKPRCLAAAKPATYRNPP